MTNENKNLEDDLFDDLDNMDSESNTTKQYSKTVEITNEIVKSDDNKPKSVKKEKAGLFSRMFKKKETTDFSKLDEFDDDYEVEELMFTQELVSDLTDTMELDPDLLDKALSDINENEKIKEILSQPTESIEHLISDESEDDDLSVSDLEQISVTNDDIDELDLSTIEIDFEENISEDENEFNEEEMVEEENISDDDNEEVVEEIDSLSTVVIDDEDYQDNNDEYNHNVVDANELAKEPVSPFEGIVENKLSELFKDQPITKKVQAQVVRERTPSDVDLGNSDLASKYEHVLSEVFENGSRGDIKEETFKFTLSEIGRVLKYAKQKINENRIELDMLKSNMERKDNKIRVLQEQVGVGSQLTSHTDQEYAQLKLYAKKLKQENAILRDKLENGNNN